MYFGLFLIPALVVIFFALLCIYLFRKQKDKIIAKTCAHFAEREKSIEQKYDRHIFEIREYLKQKHENEIHFIKTKLSELHDLKGLSFIKTDVDYHKGIHCTVAEITDKIRLFTDFKDSCVGIPNTLILKHQGKEYLSIDFPSDYLGQIVWTSWGGHPIPAMFINGEINYY